GDVQPVAAGDAVRDGPAGPRRAAGGRRGPAVVAEPAPLPRRPHALRPGQPRRGVPRGGPAVRADRGHGTAGRRMDFVSPSTWSEALAAKAEHPDALPIAGGTDVMVELNFDRRRPSALLDLTRVANLAEWAPDGDGWLRIGAGVTYRRVIDELGGRLPGLAMASRTVGSPQIRNRGTV